MNKLKDIVLSVLRIFIGAAAILGGISTASSPLRPMGGALGLVYSHRISLVLIGSIAIVSGLAIVLGRLLKKRRWTGNGLMGAYCIYLFAAVIQVAALGPHLGVWATNPVLAVLAGLLWIHWKFKTQYINPKQFEVDAWRLRKDTPDD